MRRSHKLQIVLKNSISKSQNCFLQTKSSENHTSNWKRRGKIYTRQNFIVIAPISTIVTTILRVQLSCSFQKVKLLSFLCASGKSQGNSVMNIAHCYTTSVDNPNLRYVVQEISFSCKLLMRIIITSQFSWESILFQWTSRGYSLLVLLFA